MPDHPMFPATAAILVPPISVRTYIATACLQGLLAQNALDRSTTYVQDAQEAIKWADALLRALEENPDA